MIPTKKASSDINSADNPRNETTRLSALATGFRLRTTAAPKITVSTAKIQNKNGDISSISSFEFGQSFSPFHFSTTPCMHYARRTFCHPERSEGSLDRKQLKRDVTSLVRSLAFTRDDRGYFFSFHLSTTPCITPPISRSLSL